MFGIVRGTPEAPLTEHGVKLYKESSNFRVVSLLIETIVAQAVIGRRDRKHNLIGRW